MRFMSVCVFVSSAAMLALGIYMNESSTQGEQIEKQSLETRPPCVKLFAGLISTIGIMTITAAVFAVPAYFGGYFNDGAIFIIAFSIIDLVNLLMIFDLITLNTYTDTKLIDENKKLMMNGIIHNYYYKESRVPVEVQKIVRKKIDEIQALNFCCGAGGPFGWTNNSIPVPDSCCKLLGCDKSVPTNLYNAGCYNYWRSRFVNGTYSEKLGESDKNEDTESSLLMRNLTMLAMLAMVHYVVIFMGRIWPRETAEDLAVAIIIRQHSSHR